MTQPVFTYGDRIRRKTGGAVHTISDITAGEYHFADGTFALIADQDCYDVVEKSSGFFLVAKRPTDKILDSHLHHGFEYRDSFADALRKLTSRWGGRTGRNVGERNGFLLLRFYDMPGGVTEEAWIPLYLLSPTDTPCYLQEYDLSSSEAIIAELDEAFGFD